MQATAHTIAPMYLRASVLCLAGGMACVALEADQPGPLRVSLVARAAVAHDCRRPMAVGLYDKQADKTFVCWPGAGMAPQVAAYDHGRRTWGKPVGIDAGRSNDDHDYPHLVVSADGHVHVVYSRHNRSLWIATSPKPRTVQGRWNVREIGRGLKATYPMPITASDGAITILYRKTVETDYRPIMRVRSADNGRTWSAPRPCIDHGSTRRGDHLDEIYIGAMTREPKHPRFAEGYNCSWTIAGGGPDRHKHDDYHKNMYYAFFRAADARWRAADGTDLGAHIDNTEAETHCKVYDSGRLERNRAAGSGVDIGYISKAWCDADGRPVVLFENHKAHCLSIGRWTGRRWAVTTPAALKRTRGFFDFARIRGTLLILTGDGRSVRIVACRDAGWKTVATYRPPQRVRDNFFIDNPRPAAFIFASSTAGSLWSVGLRSAEK